MYVDLIVPVIGSVVIETGLLSEVRGFSFSSALAYAGMLLLHFCGYINLVDSSLAFWGIAALLACGIALLSPREEPGGAGKGNLYLLLGAVAGLLVGMSIDASVMIFSAIIGTLLGEFFYSCTPKGRWVKFSISIFIHYFCSVGLKIIVSTAIAGIVTEGFLRNRDYYLIGG